MGFRLNFTEGVEWYWELSQNLFQSQHTYYAESLLFPLLAHLLKANHSLVSYKLLALSLNFLWLFAAYWFLKTRHALPSLAKLVLLATLSLNTLTLSNFKDLGFPDPLTTLGAVFLLWARRPGALFFGGWLAAMSHFSVTVFLLLTILSLRSFGEEPEKKIRAGASLAGVGSGWLMLQSWYTLFEYQLTSRLTWVIEKGWDFWFHFNQEHWQDLLSLQSAPHALLAGWVAAVLLIERRPLAWAMLASTGAAFGAFLITVDRPRIFVLIYWPVFIYGLQAILQSPTIASGFKQWTHRLAWLSVLWTICL